MVIDLFNHLRDNCGMKWTALISEMIALGKTQSWIAERCRTRQSHISQILNGTRNKPSWELGESIIALHKEVCCGSSDERKAA